MAQIQQTADSIDEKTVFNLALGGANRTSIVLGGGSGHGFAQISQLFAIWQDLKLPVSLLVSSKVEKYLPAKVNFATIDAANRQSNHHALTLLDSAGLVLIGPDMQITSTEQIFFAKFLTQTAVPTVLTDEALSLWRIDTRLQNNPQLTWLVSLTKLQSTIRTLYDILVPPKERGIFGVEEYLRALPVRADCIFAHDAVRLYSFVYSADTLVHTPLIGSARQSRQLVMALLPVTVWARSSSIPLFERVRLMHSLYADIASRVIDKPERWSHEIRAKLS
jgi:hypothetical protein